MDIKVADFRKEFEACRGSEEFASHYEWMSQVWDALLTFDLDLAVGWLSWIYTRRGVANKNDVTHFMTVAVQHVNKYIKHDKRMLQMLDNLVAGVPDNLLPVAVLTELNKLIKEDNADKDCASSVKHNTRLSKACVLRAMLSASHQGHARYTTLSNAARAVLYDADGVLSGNQGGYRQELEWQLQQFREINNPFKENR